MAKLKYSLKTKTDIEVQIPDNKKQYCEICQKDFISKNALAGHIGAKHKIKFEDYLVKYYMNEEHPRCPICDKDTRYLRGEYSFKRYCSEHANESRREWSSVNGFGKNGFDHNWREGLTKETNNSIAKQSSSLMGNNNPSFITEETFNINKQKLLKENNILLNLEYAAYVSYIQPVVAICDICKRKMVKKYNNLLKTPKCSSCNSGKSEEEQELFNFIHSLDNSATKNNREIINKEIDIYLENKKVGFEYNGLYWHTADRIGKSYHSDKTQVCQENGIQLFHVFSDEWKNKKEIVCSMIKHRIGKTDNTIYARNCNVFDTNKNNILKEFTNNTHISGHTNFIKGFYLENNGEIVCALTLRKPYHKTYSGMIEIARFSSKLNTNLVGGFSRLLKYAKKWSIDNGYKNILTYADLRFGYGNVYITNGFKLIGKTKPDYWYSNSKERFNRFKYRAQNGKTEKQVAEEASVKSIYGCGSNIYIL